jgi:glutathione S-transferase
MQLYYHPFSSYSQKALIAFDEYGIAFEPRLLDGPDSAAMRELEALWPMKRFPVLVDGDRTVLEASCIVEYIGLRVPTAHRLIPEDPMLALEVRMLDRVFDNYVSTPQQKVVFDALLPEDKRDGHGVNEARRMLERAYSWLDERMAGRTWAVGERFSLADCAGAPFLFYAHWTHAIAPTHTHLLAYRRRLLQRRSFARAVEAARPYRPYFPLDVPAED